MASAGSACGGVLALVVVLVACAQPSLASHTPAASIEGLTFELESGAKPACVACNDAQLNRCWSNLMASAAYPSDGQVSEAAVCELQPAMQAFWACLKACAGGGACSAEELASLGVRECAGDPIPCSLGGCPKCPAGFTAAEVMTWGCEEKSDVFADFGCEMDCGENVCGNCPPPLPAGDYEHDLAECHLQKTWEDLTEEFANETAYAGGLGRLMNEDFEVWLCMKNHPCLEALKTKGKKVPLRVRMPAAMASSQGYSSSTGTPCVFPFLYDGEYHYKCTDEGYDGQLWCGTTANFDEDGAWTDCEWAGPGHSDTFPSCHATSATQQCVFPFIYQTKTYHSCTDKHNNGQLWCATTSNYDLDGGWTSCTCGAANAAGAVHQVYSGFPGYMEDSSYGSGYASYIAADKCLGAAEIEFSAVDMLTSSSITGVEYYIYTGVALGSSSVWSTFIGCMDDDSCGTLVQGPISARKTSVTVETWYLIISKAAGYYYTYTIIWLGPEGYSLHSQMVQEMEVGQDRVVLHWGHSQDLDLWVYDGYDLSKKVGWSKKSGNFAGGAISLDVDNGSGLYGPETTQFQSLSNGIAMVWIHHWSDKYSYAQVDSTPASVDIFCYQCTDDDGNARAGYVTTVTQHAANVPTPAVSWWKVGQFEAASDGSVQWKTCQTGCYKANPVGPVPPVVLSFDAENAVTGAALSGVTFTAYVSYPADFSRCYMDQTLGWVNPPCRDDANWLFTNSETVDNAQGGQTTTNWWTKCEWVASNLDNLGQLCHTPIYGYAPVETVIEKCPAACGVCPTSCSDDCEQCGTQAGSGSSFTVGADEHYLILASMSGFYTATYEISPGLDDASATIGMVEAMAAGQDRVVLKWEHNGDLDLWVMAEADRSKSVGWYRSSGAIAGSGSSVQLDRDNWNGAYGPETTQFNYIAENVEVWIHYYGTYSPYTFDRVMNYPATVDIYCHDCTHNGQTKAGFVTSVTQDPDDVMGDAYHWWKVGKYIVNGGDTTWETCESNCYQASRPSSYRRRSIAHDDMPAKPPHPSVLKSQHPSAVLRKTRRPHAQRHAHLRRAIMPRGAAVGGVLRGGLRSMRRAVTQRSSHFTGCGNLLQSFTGDASVVYGNEAGIEYLVVSEAPGYDPVFTIVRATTYGAFVDGVFTVQAQARRTKALSAATKGSSTHRGPKALPRGVRSKAQHKSLQTVGQSLRDHHDEEPFEFMCWVFNEHTRRFVAWGTNEEVDLVKSSDINVYLSMSATNMLEAGSGGAGLGSGSGDVTYFVYSDYPDDFMGCVGTAMPVRFKTSTPTLLAQWDDGDGWSIEVSDVEYRIYSPHPNNYLGCMGWTYSNANDGTPCGTLVTSFTGSEGYVPADQSYLIVSRKSGYYTGYTLAYIGLAGYEMTSRMIDELQSDAYRVVLRWMHSSDLDLWVYSGDYMSKVGYSQTWNGEHDAITLDVDMTYGPGLETMGFEMTTSSRGTTASSTVREVWVHHYDGSFTSDGVASFPAMVDVYCSDCKYNTVQKIGYVRTVRQSTTGLGNPVKWWKAGQFEVQHSSGGNEVTWTNCESDCWAVFPGAGAAVSVSLSAKNMLTGSSISGATFYVYMDFEQLESYSGCQDTQEGCGRLVAISTGGAAVDIPQDSHYLVVGVLSGYYTSYTTIYVDESGGSRALQFVEEMAPGQNRVVLSWAHTQDLDLWVYDAANLNRKVGWSASSGTLAGGTVRLDVDNWSGLYGPETTQLQSLSSGTTMVWIHHYDNTFKNPQVQQSPASVDVYCYACTYEGESKAGYVTTVTQEGSTAPVSTGSGLKWWKAGQFVASASGVSWESCTGATCYKSAPQGPAPQVQITMSAENVVTGGSVSGVSFEIYANYPQEFMGCCDSAGSCAGCGDLAGTGSSFTVAGDEFYLVVAKAASYDSAYYEVYAGLSNSYETVDMVESMAVGQNRVVLRWGHTADLDLWAVNADNRAQQSYYPNKGIAQDWGFGLITLDKDVWSGPGVETTQFQSLTDGNVEIWVDYYGGRHTETRAGEYPATVDVYCYSCTYLGTLYAGYVTTVVQDPADLADGGMRYWKVGDFSASSNAVIWTTCTDGRDCYSNTSPTYLRSVESPKPVSARRSGTVNVPRKTRRRKAVQRAAARRALATHGKALRPLEARMAHLRSHDTVTSCGTLVARTNEPTVKVQANQHYLVVSAVEQYYHGYSEAWVNLGGGFASAEMVPTLMAAGQSRVVLRWGHGQDLDLWAYASESSSSDNQIQVGWPNTPGTLTGSGWDVDIGVQVDNTNGRLGPETTLIEFSGDGATVTASIEIWVQHYTSVFTTLQVGDFPASVDIYCEECLNDNGDTVRGYVQTVTQSASALLEVKWWKVGSWMPSVDSDGETRVSWQTCTSNCWAVYPGAGAPIAVTFSMQNVLTGGTISGTIRYTVFRNYVTSWMGCCDGDDCSACGVQVIDHAGASLLIPGSGDFLVVARASGYYARYFVLTTGSSAMSVSRQMVAEMAAGQDRVVLAWAHSGDLDLESYYDHPSRGLQRVYYANPFADFNGGEVSLDVDNGNGLLGPETIAFQDLSTMPDGSVVMVWVKHYSSYYTRSLVSGAPAKVDVFCHSCKLQFVDGTKQGYVTTVSQKSGDVPVAGAKWWKVGQFVITSGQAEWQSCGGPTCYNSEVVVPPPPITVSFSGSNVLTGQTVTDSVTYKVFAEYPLDFEGCCDDGAPCASCGALVGEGSAVDVPPDGDYLVVALSSAFYDTYYEMSVATYDTSRSLPMVTRMIQGQNRVVLRWGHTNDLDLWALNADNRGQKSYYYNLGSAQNWGFGDITLDKDVTSGPGVETTQFQDLTSGNVEIWVDKFASTYTSSQTNAFPASVDVYCHSCTYNGNSYAGYVTTVTQNYLDVSVSDSGVWRYWLVGMFKSTSGNVEWITCTYGTDCYSNSPQSSAPVSLDGSRRRLSSVSAKATADPPKKYVARRSGEKDPVPLKVRTKVVEDVNGKLKDAVPPY